MTVRRIVVAGDGLAGLAAASHCALPASTAS